MTQTATTSSHLARMCAADVLTPDAERRLFRELAQAKQDGDDATANKVRDQIVQANLRLVVSIAKRFVAPHRSLDDLVSDGVVKLMKAIESFDPERGFKFSTYAHAAISRDAARQRATESQRQGKLTNALKHLSWRARQDEQPKRRRTESKDDPSSDIVKDETNTRLARALEKLDDRQRFVLHCRFGFGPHGRVSLQRLGDVMGLSKERVRQLQQRGLTELHKLACAEGLGD